MKKGRAGDGTYCAFFLYLTADQGNFGAFGRVCVLSLIHEPYQSLGVSLSSQAWGLQGSGCPLHIIFGNF